MRVICQSIKREAQPSVYSDNTRIASIFNYTNLVSLYTKKFSIYILYKLEKSRQKYCENARVFLSRDFHGHDFLCNFLIDINTFRKV